MPAPIVSLGQDHSHKRTPFCNDIAEVLTTSGQYPDVAFLTDVRATHAHFHKSFDEVFIVVDGSMALTLYDPDENRRFEVFLRPQEVCVVPRRLHHKIDTSSPQNRLL